MAKVKKKIPIALQLYSVRQDCEKDLPGVLKAVRDMGYEGVEFAGFYNRSAEELRKMLDDLGLKCAGTHIGLETLLGDQFEKSLAYHRTLGNKYLIVPGLAKERTASKAAWLETAKHFNEIAAKLKNEGRFTGYHNHHTEFTPLPEGDKPWDVFFGNTGKDVVMQLDIGNAWHAGVDVLPYVEKFPGRATTVHLKEFSKTDPKALIGEGDVDWEKCFKLCESIGKTVWYIVEQESYKHEPMKCVDLCLQNLRKMGK